MTIDIWGSLWLFLKPILLYVTLPIWTLLAVGYLIGRVACAVEVIVTKCRTLLNRGG